MIFKTPSPRTRSSIQNRRQKKAAIEARRSRKIKRLVFERLERRNLLATFVVNSLVDDNTGVADGMVSLREAIEAANTNAAFGDAAAGDIDGDQIIFDASLTGLSQTILNGEYEITDDLIISGGDFNITIDALNNSRIFNINTTELVGFNNLSLINGNADIGGAILSTAGGTTRLTGVTLTGNTATGDGGGAIYTENGSLYATNLVARNNVANGMSGSGGAILQASGTVGLFDAVLESNVAVRAGGGIEVIDGSLFARDIILGSDGAGNTAGTAVGAAPGNGGGLHITGIANASFVGGSVVGNSAALEGGGLWNQAGSTLFVSDVDITDNRALGADANRGGGGIFNNGGEVIVVNGSKISDNSATGASGSGGGIFSTIGQVRVVDSEISSNVANRAGGGVEIIDGTFIARRSTLHGNIAGPALTAAPGNGGALHVTGNNSRSFIQATTISNNSAASEGGGLWNQEGSFLRVDRNSLIVNNVALGDAADNGGGGIFNNGGRVSVLNSTLQSNNATGTAGSGGGLFSTAGNIFVNESVFTANSANRAGGGFEIVDGRLDVFRSILQNNDAGTLRPTEAAPGNGGALHVTGVAITTLRGTLISGNTAASEGGGLWNQAGSQMFVSGTTVRNNNAFGDDADNGGGGIFNNGGNLQLVNSFIQENRAIGAAGSGGGIFSTDGRILINDTNISNNLAFRAGGGIEIIDGYTRLENVTVNRNRAGGSSPSPGNGGAVHITGNNSQFVAIGSTFFGNQAAQGGALWNQTGSTMTLRSADRVSGQTRLTGNISGGVGGGIYNKGTLLVRDAFFTSNSAAGSDGGAIFNTPTGRAFLTEVLIRNNAANDLGGGLANFGELAVVDSVFENNIASDGGAIAAIEGITSQGRNTFEGNTPNDIFRA